MTPDLFNGLFEFLGSLAVWGNVQAIYKDRGYAGGRVYIMLFFFFWSLWNLYYYPHLHQMASFIGGVSLGLANAAYVAMMFRYGRRA